MLFDSQVARGMVVAAIMEEILKWGSRRLNPNESFNTNSSRS